MKLRFLTIFAVSVFASAADRPNVLFISIDDMRDYGEAYTPNIDRLAGRGVLFENAHCSAPLCNPSRSSLLSGRRPSTTGIYSNAPVWHEQIPREDVLPSHFRRNGYHTAGAGKIFHTGKKHHPHDVWDEFFDQVMDPNPEGYPLHGIESLRTNFDWGPFDNTDLEMGDGQAVGWAMEVLQRRHEKPFFLAVGIFRPHLPFYVPRAHFNRYPLALVEPPIIPTQDLDDIPQAGLDLRQWKVRYYDTVNRLGRLNEVVQGYLASCTFADALVGRLLETLDSSPYAGNTIIVLWSDHGWHLGEKHKVNKHTLWEEATRVPLIWVVPGVTSPGGRSGEAVSLLDIYPTLIELCDLPTREGLEGLSLRPQLADPEAPRDRPALTTFGYQNHAIRDDRWKYIRYRDGSEELYDHAADPNEWTNLASSPQAAEIKSHLARWLPESNAQPVAPNAYPNRAPRENEW